MIICTEMTSQKKSPTPQLALCLIACNEEQLLPACLESARGVAHEVVVLDTGSTDGTAEVADCAGATVVHHAWEDDFAAARNAALEASSTPWVLLLDADERLAPGAGEAIREALQGDLLDCGLLPLYQATRLDASAEEVLDGSARDSDPVLLPRLFRRTPDLFWEGVVHEHVRRWLDAEGRRVAVVDAPIIHLGGVRQLRDAQHKQERNLRLLRTRVVQDPHDSDARTYLAQELWNAGLFDEASKQVERAWSDLLEQAASGSSHSSPVNAATLRALSDILALDFSRALETLNQARQLQQQEWSHPNLGFLTGVAQENLAAGEVDPARRTDYLQQARLSYQEALGGHQRFYADQVLAGATTWAGARRLGTVALQLGMPDLALTAFEAALEGRPQDSEAQLGRSEALLNLGRTSDAMAQLRPLLAEGGADAWVLAARALEQGGASEEARQCRRQARELVGDKMLAPHREAWLHGEPGDRNV